MGAWGSGILENDSAQDFIAAVLDETDLTTIEEAIERVLATGGDYLEAPAAEEAIAAVSLIARLLNDDDEEAEDGDEIQDWISQCEQIPDDVLVEKASKALERILTDPSELLEQWQESDDFDVWERGVRALQKSL
jgi:hypothetical protein